MHLTECYTYRKSAKDVAFAGFKVYGDDDDDTSGVRFYADTIAEIDAAIEALQALRNRAINAGVPMRDYSADVDAYRARGLTTN